jgi:non-homologous end joining protein Ku
MLHKKDLSRVKEVWFCAEEDKPIDRSDIVKGYETSKGAYVVVEDEELKKIAPPTATTMDILQFVVALERSHAMHTAHDDFDRHVEALRESHQAHGTERTWRNQSRAVFQG